MRKLLNMMMLFSAALSAAELECATLLNTDDSPTTTSIRWTDQPEAIGYEVTVGTSQFENDIIEQTIYTENFTEELILPPNTTIYVIIIPFSNTQFAVGCEYLRFTTSDCGYAVNPVSEMTLCYSVDVGNELNADFGSIKTNLLGEQANLNISYFDMEGNPLFLQTLQPDEGDNTFTVLARMEDDLNCVKEVEFRLSLFRRPETSALENVVVCNSFTLPETEQGNVYYSENGGLLAVGTVISDSQTIIMVDENSPCSEERVFTVTVDPNICNSLEAGTDYPNYFTPNGDGINDYWNIPDSININILSILIHDRYGNLISQFSINDLGWDGTFRGSPLPASDYWFVLQTENKPISGHFALKR